MPKRKSIIDIDSESSCSSKESYDEDSEISSSEDESDFNAANEEFSSNSDEELDNVPLINWKQIRPNKPTEAESFPFTGKPGITIPVDRKWTELDYVKLFIDNNIVNIIVTETNRYAQKYLEKKYSSQAERNNYGRYPFTTDEFWAFFAILIYQSIIIKPKQRWYWTRDKLFHTPFAESVMPLSRFEKIMKFLHSSDDENYNETEHPCPKLHKIWEIYQAINNNFQKIYVPKRDVSIDESLMASKHHLSFLQFIPSNVVGLP